MWLPPLRKYRFANGNPAGTQSIRLHMNPFHVVLALLFAFPSQPYIGETQGQQSSCKGAVHGIVLGQDGKPWGGIGLILEPVGAYDYLLPRVKTDQWGEYRFENACGGK